MAHDVFISYSTKDKVTADAICHILEENDMKCWIAPRNISSGQPYAEEILNAIKTTKIVVLVFSSNSQASQFVQKEINLSFSNGKPIISFVIDESLPQGDLEFYLKTNHWLDAYPEPEVVFSKLVTDASRLIGDEKHNPIIDSNVMEKARNGEFNQPSIKNEWKSFIFLATPLYPIALIYMGLSAKMKKITIQGVICMIPLLLFLVLSFYGAYMARQQAIAAVFVVILWIISVAYILVIRKDYLFRKSVINSVSDDKELFTALIEEYANV
ncbi:MAG: toll/interleukin-1 receptor domain-containing protein [Methanobrevibacter sp.]|nr:toll/interleukin-1 receptor domain-containing protein [Methanobrevibacter sp.]MBQ2654786.1 toll/interleukin-1 receptor domain-containing protein [Methanobrevibacter sp.]